MIRTPNLPLALLPALALAAACQSTPSLGAGEEAATLDPAASAVPPEGYTLVWSDEFNTGDMPDPAPTSTTGPCRSSRRKHIP